jgi:hypothetical protein
MSSIAPNVLRIGEDQEEIVDYKALNHIQIVDLVAHYFANALLPFFEPENHEEKSLTIMPLSEEFVESRYNIHHSNIIQSQIAEL